MRWARLNQFPPVTESRTLVLGSWAPLSWEYRVGKQKRKRSRMVRGLRREVDLER